MRICGLKNRRDRERSIERSVLRRYAHDSLSILGISGSEIQSGSQFFEAEFRAVSPLDHPRRTLNRGVAAKSRAQTGILNRP